MPTPRPKGLSPGDIRRVSSSTRWFESHYRLPGPGGPRGPVPSSERLVPVLCPSGGITAGSDSSPTSGTGHFMVPNNGGPGLNQGDSVTLYHREAVAVPGGSKKGWATWFAGHWYLVSWEC